MGNIELVDVSVRDGNQSLWGATGLRTAHVVQAAPLLERAGFRALDYTSSTHMGMAVRTFSEDPWERLSLVRAAMPRTKLQFIGTGFRFYSWETMHPEVMRFAYGLLTRHGMDRAIVLDPMHDMDAALPNAAAFRDAGFTEIVGALVFTVSKVHTDAYYAGLARTFAASPHIDRLYVKDPSGLLSPERAGTLLPAIRAAAPDTPLELHSHCTIGQAPLTYSVAAAHVDALHVALGPLADGSSLPDAEQTIRNLRELGHTVDVDDAAIRRAARFFHGVAEAEGLPSGAPGRYDVAFLRHQIAGGVMTTTRRQLAELGLEDRFDEVIDEVSRVRAELGHPIMVTPFPQMVCTQALFNVIGNERYDQVPDQVINYVLGRFGRPAGPIDPAVKDRIDTLPRTKELASAPPPRTLSELRAAYGERTPDEELLLRAVMPADQVDALCAAPAPSTRYTPELPQILATARVLGAHPDVTTMRLRTPTVTVSARRENHHATRTE